MNKDIYHLYDDEKLNEPEDSTLTPEQKVWLLWQYWYEQQLNDVNYREQLNQFK